MLYSDTENLDSKEDFAKTFWSCPIHLGEHLKAEQRSDEDDSWLIDHKCSHDSELNLGSSILFDHSIKNNVKKESSSYSDRDCVPSENESHVSYPLKKSSYCLTSAIDNLFSRDPHPTAAEMNKLTGVYSVKYRTIFEIMERKRAVKDVICDKGDNCERIRTYFENHDEPFEPLELNDELKELLEKLVEDQIFSGRRFDLGYVHVIMERTNLPFTFVRSFHAKWKKRLNSAGIPGYTIEDWRRDHRHANLHAKVFTHESFRKMEEVYLKKKYESDDKEWTDEEISRLSIQLGHIPIDKIIAWIRDRNSVAHDAYYIDLPRCGSRADQIYHTKKSTITDMIPSRKLNSLKEVYIKNKHPTKREYKQIAFNLELKEGAVRSFYGKNNTITRKKEGWKEAKHEISQLDSDKIRILESVASNRKLRASDHKEWADKIGISYRSLRSYVESNKSTRCEFY